MVQESPSEPDPSETAEEGAGSGPSDDPVAGTMEGQPEEGSDAGGDDESSVEDAVDEAVSEAEGRTEAARESVEGASDEMAEAVSEKSETVSEKTNEMAEKTEVVVETAPDEEAALRRVQAVGKLLDDAVRIPGTNFRVGLDPILGVVPGGGDAVAAALALYPVAEAYRLDAPAGTIAKMLSLIAVDLVLGSVPIVGTLFDAFWKANEWNARALERHLEGV